MGIVVVVVVDKIAPYKVRWTDLRTNPLLVGYETRD